jgi:hypothetical protein
LTVAENCLRNGDEFGLSESRGSHALTMKFGRAGNFLDVLENCNLLGNLRIIVDDNILTNV